jgi:hypothetical protein
MGVFDYKRQFVVPCYLDLNTGEIVPQTTSGGVDDEIGVAIAVSGSGATALVTANSTKRIRVTSIVLVSNGTVNVKFQSAATDVTGLAYLVANTGFSSGYNPKGHFQTAINEALNINLSGAIAVGGWLKYVLV